MQICTYKECAEWCAAHGYPTQRVGRFVNVPIPALTEPEFRFVMFLVPEDAGRRVALTKALMTLVDTNSELLIQIDDWGVWESCQHMPLFDRFRQAFRECRPLDEAPGHVLSASERDDAISILVMSVLYSWDCYVLSAEGDQAVFVSHDEHGWFAARNFQSLEPAVRLLEYFGVLKIAG